MASREGSGVLMVNSYLKRKAEDEGGRTVTRSYTGVYGSKCDCMFCGEECLPLDEKHPDRWDRFRECLTKERFDKDKNPLPTMRDLILEAAEQR